MDLITLVLGFLIALSIFDLIKFLGRFIFTRIYFNRMMKKMQKEIDELVYAKNQMQSYPTKNMDNEGWEEVPVEVIAPKKSVTH